MLTLWSLWIISWNDDSENGDMLPIIMFYLRELEKPR